MDRFYQCPLCRHNFSSLQRIESHLKRKISCVDRGRDEESVNVEKLPEKITIGHNNLILKPDVFPCQYCKKTFASKDNLSKHLKLRRCRVFSKIYHQSNLGDPSQISFCDTFSKNISHLPDDDRNSDSIILENLKKEIDELKEIVKTKEKNIIIEELKKEIDELKETAIELKKEPRVNNQILQLISMVHK